jgi:hypothetical protein
MYVKACSTASKGISFVTAKSTLKLGARFCTSIRSAKSLVYSFFRGPCSSLIFSTSQIAAKARMDYCRKREDFPPAEGMDAPPTLDGLRRRKVDSSETGR